MQFNISKYLEYLNGQIFGENIEYIKETQSTNDDLWSRKQPNYMETGINESGTEGVCSRPWKRK